MSFAKTLRRFCQALFFPQACVVCGKWVLNPDFSPLCRACLVLLERLPPRVCYYCGCPLPGNILEIASICSKCRSGSQAFDFARAYGPYQGSLRRVVQKFKFEGFQRLASPLAALLEQCYQQSQLNLSLDWIVPVPPHPRRRRRRGFDHTLLLSRVLSRSIGIPVFGGLRRVRNTPRQFGFTAEERQQNVAGAFTLRQGQLLSERGLLLIDDVFTTGATTTEISKLLKEHSTARKITVLTVARVCLLYS